MKNITNQYIDLREGKITQANFMRNLRMSLPQYVTNVTSFNDAVKILKNKGIITESEVRYTPASEGMLDSIAEQAESFEDAVMQLVDYGVQESVAEMIAAKFHDEEGKENGGNYSKIIPALKAKGITSSMPEKKIINAIAKVMEELGYTDNQILNLINRDEDFISDLLQDLKNSTNNKMNEAKEKMPKGNSGKELYDQFEEGTQFNFNEVVQGIGIEHQYFPDMPYNKIAKLVYKNLKKDPQYYTNYKLSGIKGFEPKYMDNVNPKDYQMQFLTKDNLIDKPNVMKPVKGFEKAKADSNKAKKDKKPKTDKIDLMSLVAKSVRGLQKMDATGEKMKKIVMKEVRVSTAPGEEPNDVVKQALQFIKGNNELKAISDEISLQNNHDEAVLRYGYWEQLKPSIVRKLELQFNVNEDYEFDDERGSLYAYLLKPKSNTTAKTPGEAVAKALTKETLLDLVREIMAESGVDGGDNMIDDEETSMYN